MPIQSGVVESRNYFARLFTVVSTWATQLVRPPSKAHRVEAARRLAHHALLTVATTAVLIPMLMIWFMNAYDYPILIGGKPMFSPTLRPPASCAPRFAASMIPPPPPEQMTKRRTCEGRLDDHTVISRASSRASA